MKQILFHCLVISALAKVTLACNGCLLKKFALVPCPETQSTNAVQVKITDVVLTSDCIVKPKGWVNFTQPISEINAKWSFKKGKLTRQDTADGCKELMKMAKDKDFSEYMSSVGMSKKCPLPKGNVKINKNVNVSKSKAKLAILNGLTTGKVDATHNGGGRTCYTYEVDFECKS